MPIPGAIETKEKSTPTPWQCIEIAVQYVLPYAP